MTARIIYLAKINALRQFGANIDEARAANQIVAARARDATEARRKLIDQQLAKMAENIEWLRPTDSEPPFWDGGPV